jgi:hypothetical protein
MGTGSARALALALAVLLACSDVAVVTAQETERIEGTRRRRDLSLSASDLHEHVLVSLHESSCSFSLGSFFLPAVLTSSKLAKQEFWQLLVCQFHLLAL